MVTGNRSTDLLTGSSAPTGAKRKGRLLVMRDTNKPATRRPERFGALLVRGRSRARRYAVGLIIAALAIVVMLPAAPLGANGERRISLYNIHTKNTLTVVYKRNGRFLPDALKKLNWHLRDWRRDEPTRMDPALIDLVWEIHAELGSRSPIHVISGYRSPATNNLLRKTRGGQARRSQHLLGTALDVRVPVVPVRRLRYSALLREQGGVGYYPTSATPFVHVDTGRVRHWPRMDRYELALLFPHGRTRHRPSRGGPISRQDAVAARNQAPALSRRVAAFHRDRHAGPPAAARTQVASARPRPPRLIQEPRAARRPQQPLRTANASFASTGIASGWSASIRSTASAPRTNAESRSRRPAASRRSTAQRPKPFAPPPAISTSDRDRLAQLASAPAIAPASAFAERIAQPTRDGEQWISAPAFDEEHPVAVC